MRSIISEENKCFICGSECWLEEHHIFPGPNRKNSEQYGLKVKLCHFCHNEPPLGAHHNRGTELMLKEIGQREFEKHYSRQEFMRIFGRNYL